MTKINDFLINVHDATNEAVLKYFDDKKETVTHYTSPNGFLNIIQSKELWFGNINNVNDITEINYAFNEIINPCIKNYRFLDSSLSDKVLALTEKLKEPKFSFIYGDEIKLKKASIFVFSTSFDDNSTVLWELYCKNSESKGYAITFYKNMFTDILCECNIKAQTNDGEYNSTNNEPHHLLVEGKVIYERKKQIEIVNDYLSHLEDALEQQTSEDTKQALLDIYVQKFILMALFMKDIDFDKEKEYRFAVVCDDEFIDTEKRESSYLVFGTNNGNIVSRLAVPFGVGLIHNTTISPFISDVKAVATTRYFLDKNGITKTDILHKSPKIRK